MGIIDDSKGDESPTPKPGAVQVASDDNVSGSLKKLVSMSRATPVLQRDSPTSSFRASDTAIPSETIEKDKFRISMPSPVPSRMPHTVDGARASEKDAIALSLPSSVPSPSITHSDNDLAMDSQQTNQSEQGIPGDGMEGSLPQVMAELAPNTSNDVAAHVAQQLEEQMDTKWQKRLQEEVHTRLQAQRPQGELVDAVQVDEEGNILEQKDTRREEVRSQRQRRFRMILVVVLFLTGGLAGMTVANTSSSDTTSQTTAPTTPSITTFPPTIPPTFAPTNPRLKYLLDTLGPWIAPNNNTEEGALLENSESPQSRALTWLSEEDGYSSHPENMESRILLERYALVVLYFATLGENWLKDISFLNTSTSICKWNDGSAFEEGTSLGVYCSSVDQFGVATFLNLEGVGLQGTIPPDIAFLENLINLNLQYNSLSGSLPSNLDALTDLVGLYLMANEMTGTLPIHMPDSLKGLWLEDNHFSGTLPRDWPNIVPSLLLCSLYQNEITGSIPTEYGAFRQVEYFDLGGNDLTGTIPTELASMTTLTTLGLEESDLHGTIPTQFGNLLNIENLFVYSNPGLYGTVPSELGNLDKLVFFLFDGTSLTGSVDSILCPTNQGTFPVMVADCLVEPSNGDNMDLIGVECSCCTMCCLPGGGRGTCEYV